VEGHAMARAEASGATSRLLRPACTFPSQIRLGVLVTAAASSAGIAI
jgi:hypothetical protein